MPAAPKSRSGRFGYMRTNIFLVLISLLLTLLTWQAATGLGDFPPFILPSPMQVWLRFVDALQDGSLLRNSAVTLFEVLSGLALGASLAAALGYLLAKSLPLERLLSPYIVASQSIPIVAIAPLLVIWFGP